MQPDHQRLRRSPDVRAVLRRGRRTGTTHAIVHVRPRGDDEPGRVTAVASRRVGNAVRRNRAKRVLRAAMADVGIAAGADVAVVARPGTADARSWEVARELQARFPRGLGAAVEARA